MCVEKKWEGWEGSYIRTDLYMRRRSFVQRNVEIGGALMSPEISEEEFLKFKELLDKEKEREKTEKIRKEIYIDQLSKKVDALLDLNKSYGPIEAYALTFYKFLVNDFKAHKTDTLWFSWTEIQRYLTNVCMEKDPFGRTRLSKAFREHLLDRGIKTNINRKYNTFKVSKCQPRKRKK